MAGELGGLVVVAVERVVAVLSPQRIDVNRAVRRLCRNVLVQGVPGDTLDVMAVFGDLAHKSS